MTAQQRRIMRSREVFARVGYSNMHLTRLEKAGKFPKRFKITSQAQGAAVGWWEDEIEAWLAARGSSATAPGEAA